MVKQVKLLILPVLLATMLITMLITGCASAPTPSTPSAPINTSSTPVTEILKIGQPIALNWPLGLWHQALVDLDVSKVNANGGLDIGGKKYKIDVITTDNKMDQALGKTAAERLIFQDGVKFMMTDMWPDAIVNLCETNKVLSLAYPASDLMYTPSFKYAFQGVPNHTNFMSAIPWAAKWFKNLKTILFVLPDREDGRYWGKLMTQIATASGFQPLEPVYYPPTATDLSAVGTKVKMMNPDILVAYGGGPGTDSVVFKAAYVAGYRGQQLDTAPIPGGVMVGITGPEVLEGMICEAWPMEFEPALTPASKQFKDEYTAKFGKWDYPDIIGGLEWFALKAGLQQAGSIEMEKVASVLNNGVKFETPMGPSQMIPRPDMGISRTVAAVIGDMPIKQIVKGELKLIDTITLQEELDLCKIMYGWK